MDLSSFLDNKKDKAEKRNDAPNDGAQGESRDNGVDFLKNDDIEKDSAGRKKGSSVSAGGSSRSRLNDMLISPPPEESAPEEAKGEKNDNDKQGKKSGSGKNRSGGFFSGLFGSKSKKNNKSGLLSGNDDLEVNLVKDEIIQFFDWQKNILWLLLVILASLFVLTMGYWFVSWRGNRMQVEKDQFLAQDYYRLNKQIRELEPEIKEIMEFQRKLNMVNYLLENHIYWTNFFDFLEKNTLEDVYFFDFSGNTSGSYSLDGRARYFEVLDAQKKKFLEDDRVTSAQIKSGSVVSKNKDDSAGVAFTINFTVDPDIFHK